MCPISLEAAFGTYFGPNCILCMGYTVRRWARLAYWNLWPAARLLLVLGALAVWEHRNFGWSPPSLLQWGEVAGGLTILFLVCAVFSRPLAHLGLALLCCPFYAAIVINCLFYDGFRLMTRQIFGRRSPCLEAGLALAGELCIFTGLWRAIELLLRTCCHG